MWHPSSKLSVVRNRSKGKSDGFCHHVHARHHEIESQWHMVAFDIAGRAVSRTHWSCRLHACGTILASCWEGRRSEPIDPAEDVGEQVTRDGDLGHLEDDVATMADDLRADLDELFAQRGQ